MQVRLCKCGCGKPAKRHYSKIGKFKGYAKYSEFCVDKIRLASAENIKKVVLNLKKHPRETHNMTNSSTYTIWVNMIQRCTNSKVKCFSNYGGRGIAVCDYWKNFNNFLLDMGSRPESMTLDRIDNNKGYFKENCRWVTQKENTRNTRRNIFIEFNGEKECLAYFCEKYKLDYRKTWTRLFVLGYSPEKAFLDMDIREKNNRRDYANRRV
jgi:hypothetical protein